MFQHNDIGWIRIISVFLLAATLALGVTTVASARSRDDVKKAQQTLRDKGYNPGPVDGHMGPQTREAIGQYQKAEDLPRSQRLDGATAGRLGVEPESVGSSFKGAGHEVGEGGEQFGHEIAKGKPIAAGKELGKGIGRGGQKVGEGTKKAVSTESDRGDAEKRQ